jgi:aminopeptidase-like protein
MAGNGPGDEQRIDKETPEEVAACFDRLWPLLRSITGEGVRRTHDILGELLPLQRTELETGRQILDWKVPPEWVVREAYLTDPEGRRRLDVADHNLHLLNYSTPFRGRVDRDELEEHLYSLPEQPGAIPYVTSYYKPRWGFCLTEEERRTLPAGEYEVVIDTEHKDGSMTMSDAVLPGASDREVLLSTYTCHPSLANNELSGPLVLAFLYRRLAQVRDRRLTYRFVFVPETVGAIAYLAQHGDHLLAHVDAGYVATCVGTDAGFVYKRSRRADTLADRAAHAVLRRRGEGARFVEFRPSGSDERQYCSPGFDLPVGSIMRTPHSEYDEYHSSLDDRSFVSFPGMVASVDAYFDVCMALDNNARFVSAVQKGEPHYSRWGLTGGTREEMLTRGPAALSTLQWLVNYADGEHDLIDISERSGVGVPELRSAAERCVEVGLLRRVEASS